MNEVSVKSSARTQFIDITSEVQKAVSESNVREGICLIYCPHTTAAITVNEGADPSVAEDIIAKLDRLVPEQEGYKHAEGNSDAHIKSSLLGCSELIPVQNGKLVLGTWQAIFFCEFDGPRERKVLFQIK